MKPNPNANHPADRWAIALLVTLGAVILGPHVVTAGPYSVDLAELTLCAWSGSVPHSPGYPLWTRTSQATLALLGEVDPIHALGRMGVVLAILSALMTQRLLRQIGVTVWTATGSAALLLVVPLCIRAFSIPEVYAFDLMLMTLTFWATHRGHSREQHSWTALGVATGILAMGHRPVNAILMVTIALAWPDFRKKTKGVATGLGIGILLQALLYWDLWERIQDPQVLWVDEHVQATWTSFSRFVIGLPFEKFFFWASNTAHNDFNYLTLGAQCLGLMIAALLIPVSTKGSRLGWALFLMASWHLVFTLIFQVSDREYLLFPVLWVGILSIAFSTQLLPEGRQSTAGKTLLAGVLVLALINARGLVEMGHKEWREPLRDTLHKMPDNAIVLSDDWPSRTQLVALREMEGLGHSPAVVRISLEGGDIQRLNEWFQGKTSLVLLEERKEIEELRPVRVHDSRLLPLLIEQGLITKPAEAGTWSVEQGSP